MDILSFHINTNDNIVQVHELCDNFCGRYIEALKTRMPGDLIMNQRRNPNAVKAPHELDDSPAHNQFAVASSQVSCYITKMIIVLVRIAKRYVDHY